jgi:predicted phage terminase large subunit-like protein
VDYDAAELMRLWKHLTPKERREIEAILAAQPPSFRDFVRATVKWELDPWQVWLCDRLERLRYETGQRIILTVCPQIGKSVIIAQRLIPYLIGCSPESRNGIASLNVTKSIDHSKVMQSLMRGHDYARMFPADKVRITADARQDQFSVRARADMNDGQPSVVALGTNTNFVGRGWDKVLVLDDPYSSAGEAFSPRINELLRLFWAQTLEPRLSADVNVIVCFHRYHDQDLAGWLMERDPAGWEYIRLAAVADGDPSFPDPLGREPGELLSPRLTHERLQKLQDEDPFMFSAQFQGLPYAASGGFFERQWFEDGEKYRPLIESLPELDHWVRAWDVSVSAKTSGDFSVGALCGMDGEGNLVVADIARQRGEWADIEELIVRTAQEDLERFGKPPRIALEEDGLGLLAWQNLCRRQELRGVPIERVMSRGRGDKRQRAAYWQSLARNGRLRLLRAPWVEPLKSEAQAFHGRHGGRDDQVDAISLATHVLTTLYGGKRDEPEPPRPGSLKYYEQLARGRTVDARDHWAR